jgi:hypothetical protein
MNWEGCGRKRSWPNLRYSLRICLEGLRKITNNFNQDIRSRGPGFKSSLPEYEVKWMTRLVRRLVMAVPWLRWLVTGLSPRRPGFAPGSIHVGFAVDKVALGHVSLRVLRFSPVSIIPPSLSTLISSGECIIC